MNKYQSTSYTQAIPVDDVILQEPSAVSNSGASSKSSKTANEKFGKVLYRLESTTVAKVKQIYVFYEEVLVIQTEKEYPSLCCGLIKYKPSFYRFHKKLFQNIN